MEIKNRFHIEIFTYKVFGTLTPLIIKISRTRVKTSQENRLL